MLDTSILKPPDTLPFIDKIMIGVIVILGSTYTGHLETLSSWATCVRFEST